MARVAFVYSMAGGGRENASFIFVVAFSIFDVRCCCLVFVGEAGCISEADVLCLRLLWHARPFAKSYQLGACYLFPGFAAPLKSDLFGLDWQ